MDKSNNTAKSISDSIRTLSFVPYFVNEQEKDIVRYTTEKTLRISSAAIRLVALLDNGHPTRRSIERTSMRLIEDSGMAPSSRDGRVRMHDRLRTLAALLATAELSRLISRKSVSILMNEISALTDLLVSSGWFETHERYHHGLDVGELADDVWRADTYKGPSATPKGLMYAQPAPVYPTQSAEQQKVSMQQKDTQRREVPQHYKERVQEVQKDRRATILALLQRKDRVGVKDVANVIRDVSEKTIQRELLALVRQGVLVKEGERRWSTYRMA
jgi:DNA-binding transcriptional ArsR family regulator